MLHIHIIAVGRLRASPLLDLCEDYQSRIRWKLTLQEIDTKPDQEEQKILSLLDPRQTLIVLDETGQHMKSRDFASKLETLKDQGQNKIQFVLGGADGLTQTIRDRADLLLSFGRQTWPHMIARVMLLEQIYRAEQICSGHPYHRD